MEILGKGEITKTQVSEQAVRDLAGKIFLNTNGQIEILKTVRKCLPKIKDGQMPGLEIESDNLEQILRAIVDQELKREPNQDREELAVNAMRIWDCLNELDYYIDKKAVLNAAIVQLNELKGKKEKLRLMQGQIENIFKRIDNRTKAFFEIVWELIRTDGVNNTDFANLLNNLGDIDVNVLSNEPELAPLLEAYKLAKDINEVCD